MATIQSTIISGANALNAVAPVVKGKKKVLFISDANIIKLAAARQILSVIKQEVADVHVVDSCPPEPSHLDARALLEALAGQKVDLIVGLGGGSVMDMTKLMSVLLADGAPTIDELLAGVKPSAKIPSMLIPSTAGTGSEATPNAIFAIPEKKTKQGIITDVFLPTYVGLFPELTTSMPAKIASSTGIDALCHLLECYTSCIANPVSDNAAVIGMYKLFRNLEVSVADPSNLQAKLEMLWASYYGGVAINHAGTHLVHALSYPLGGTYHIPHGVANAILMAPCMKAARSGCVEKFAKVYDLLPDADASLSDEAKSFALVEYLEGLVRRLNLPDRLEPLGVPHSDVDRLSDAALDVKRLMNNAPRKLSKDEVKAIYETLF